MSKRLTLWERWEIDSKQLAAASRGETVRPPLPPYGTPEFEALKARLYARREERERREAAS